MARGLLIALALVATFAVARCDTGKDRVFNELDEYLAADQYKDIEANLYDQRTYSRRVAHDDAKLGELVDNVASLEAKITATQYAIKRKVADELKSAVVKTYGATMSEEDEAEAMVLVGRALLRGHATSLAVNQAALSQVYELSKEYQRQHKDATYRELALGLPREPLNVDKDLEVQQETIEALKGTSSAAAIAKADSILDQIFQCSSCSPLAYAKQTRPLADEQTVAEWVKQYASSTVVDGYTSGLPRSDGAGNIDLQTIEKFRAELVEKNGLSVESN